MTSDPARFHAISDDLWRPERVVAAPDGQTVAFIVAATAAGDTSQTGIWCGRLTGDPARLTPDAPATNLAFSADGSRLAYAVSGDDGAAELVIRDLDGGDPVRHPIAGYPETIAWATACSLFVLVAEPGGDTSALASGKPLTTHTPAPQGPNVQSTRTRAGWRRVWRLDVASGQLDAVSPSGLTIWEFTRLDDARVVAVCGPDPAESGWYHPVLAVLGPGPGDRRDLHVSSWQLSSPTVSPDRTRVAFLEGWTSDRGLHTGDVRIVDLGSGEVVPAPLAGADATWIRWTVDDRLWFAGWSGLGTAWGWIDEPTGAARATVHHEAAECVTSRWHPEVVPLPGDRAITVYSTVAGPPEVAVLTGGAARPWSTLNAGIATDRGLRVRELRWPDPAGGAQIEGLLAVPADGSHGPWPLIVDIHGGPTLAYHHGWDVGWAETLTANGYAVLMPNPCGGAGRGQEFGRRNLADPAGAEFDQVVAGVRHCVEQGYAEAGRVAAMGASYGGYLTAWAVATGGVFACGVVIAGISDLASCRGTANNGPFYDYLCAGTPGDNPALYIGRSPIARITERSRPALILHGELDRCVPVGQAHELFSGLYGVGVAAELAVYPGEGHQTQAIVHVRDQRERVLSWFAEHLG